MNNAQIQRIEASLRKRSRDLEEKKKKVGPEQKRIGFATDLLMKMIAAVTDLLGLISLIPLIGWILSFMVWAVATVGLALSYLFLGMKPVEGKSGKKTLILRIIMFFIELFPYINIVPGFSIAVWYTNSVVRKEDKEYNMRMRAMRQEIANEERALQRESQQFQISLEQSAADEQEQQYEEAVINQISDNDDEEELAA